MRRVWRVVAVLAGVELLLLVALALDHVRPYVRVVVPPRTAFPPTTLPTAEDGRLTNDVIGILMEELPLGTPPRQYESGSAVPEATDKIVPCPDATLRFGVRKECFERQDGTMYSQSYSQ